MYKNKGPLVYKNKGRFAYHIPKNTLRRGNRSLIFVTNKCSPGECRPSLGQSSETPGLRGLWTFGANSLILMNT